MPKNSNGIKVSLRLGEILQDMDVTQKDFAELAGLSQNAVSALCRGAVTQIGLDTLAKIVRVTGRHINEILAVTVEQ